MDKQQRRRDPGLLSNIGRSITLFAFLFIFGAINLEDRIVITALVFLGISLVGWILWLSKVSGSRGTRAAQIAVFPAMLLIWIGVALRQQHLDKAVIPTAEYEEEWPSRLYSVTHENVALLENATWTMSGVLPVIDGATSFESLYSSIANTVAPGRGYPSEKIDCSRTPEAFARLIKDEMPANHRFSFEMKADMIFVFRPSRQQIEAAAARGKELRITPIGYDAFVFFVNADNPVDDIGVDALRDIYAGRMTNWRDVGGENKRILPFQRYEGSGSQGAMERFMEDDTLMAPDREHRFEFMRGIVAHTARYRNLESAVGYSFLYYVQNMLAGGGVKLLKVDGVHPSRETVQDRSYPLVEEICVVTDGSQNPNVQPFIDWILSPQGQAMVEAIGYIPVNPAAEGAPFPRARVNRR